MDDDAALLPSQNINFVTLPLKTNANTNYLVLIGNRDNNYPTDNNAQVWGKVEDNSEEAKAEPRSEEHTSELQSRQYLVCRLLLEKKKKINHYNLLLYTSHAQNT